MLDQINDLILRLEHWGYVIVFLIVLLECQAFLGFFMPGESMVMVAGFLAGEEVLDIRVLILVVAVAAIFGDSIGYEFGRRLGRDWLWRHGEKFWLRPERLERMDVFFVRYGGWSVLFAHFLHVGRASMPFLAGAARLPYLRFVAFNAVGCILWAAIYSLLGYLFGQSWHLIDRWIGRAGAVAAILAAMLVATLVIWRGIASREPEIRGWWRRFLARSEVENFRRRFARQIDWLEQRLSPDGFLGIHLTMGIFLLLAATATFGGLFQKIGAHDWFVAADLRVATWFAEHSGVVVSQVMSSLAKLASPYWLVAFFLTAVITWGRERHRLRLLLVAAPGGVLLKYLFAKEGPRFGRALGHGVGFVPVDGDLMTATIIYGALAYILARSLRRWSRRALVTVVTVLLICIVAFSSLYLRASELSEVLAAMIEGTAWLFFCISGVEIVRWREEAQRAALLSGSIRRID